MTRGGDCGDDDAREVEGEEDSDGGLPMSSSLTTIANKQQSFALDDLNIFLSLRHGRYIARELTAFRNHQ